MSKETDLKKPLHKKYGHVVIVIHQCGISVTKEMFLKHFKDLKPDDRSDSSWTVDHFLDANRDAIKSKSSLSKYQIDILFPRNGKETNIEEWDLNLFCYLLYNYCTNFSDKNVRHDIKCLKTMRNEIFHKGEGDIPDHMYKTYIDRLRGIVDRCVNKFLENPDLKAELDVVIDKRPDEIQYADVIKREEQLRQWHVVEVTLESVVPIIVGGEIRELKRILLDSIFKSEECGLPSKATPISIVVKLCLVGKNGHDEEVLALPSDTVYPEGAHHTLSYKLANNVEKIKEDARKMGVGCEEEKTGSIIFNFTCFSVTSVIYLIDYISGPIMEKRIQDITNAIENVIDESVTFQVSIPPESYEKITKTLEDDLEPQAKRRKLSGKIFNDPLYGQIELHPLCVKIIDTPQFQRLRHIKQLESVYMVYPGASHNRFEHSIGVCYLAGKLMRVLKERQPELDITTKDVLCVEIAALCHDLGQGPFSHVFEHKFIPASNPQSTDKWKHETASVMMFQNMLEENDGRLHKLFQRMIPGFAEMDIEFIKESIGVPLDLSTKVWEYKGRKKNKSFLYEVVANNVHGIDVDRWDYIARDSFMLGMKTVFDHNRLIQHARVLVAEGRRQLCFRDKAAQDVYDMFYSRMTLYRRAYQHKTHNIIGMMIRDALLAANGRSLQMSQAINDMKAFTYLTDDILQQIMRSSEDGLETSKKIIDRIHRRDFYKCVTQTQIDVKKIGWQEKEDVQDNLFNKIKQKRPYVTDLSDILEIDVVDIDYGSKDIDPVTKVWFFKKEQEDKAIRINKEQVSFVLPDTFAEQYVRVYSSVTDPDLFDVIGQSFSEWCVENGIPQPKGVFIPAEDKSSSSEIGEESVK